MQKLILYLIPIIFLTGFDGRVNVRSQSAEEEADYAWGVIRDINFFEKNKYQISLPVMPGIEELKEKSRKGELKDSDYEQFKKEFISKYYKEREYEGPVKLISSKIEKIEKGIEVIKKYSSAGIIKLFDNYTIKLTLYGSGGSYNPESGEIILLVNKEGTFRGGRTPEEIILHEMTHLAIEDMIIARYNLNHMEKERLVDLFCKHNFNDLLPGYLIQNMGFSKIDSYFKTDADWMNLPGQVEKYLKEKSEK